MTKPVIARERARADVEAAVDFYAAEAGEAVALRFVAAVEAAYRFIASTPGGGSPRYGEALDLPGLRHRTIAGYPYLVFYVDRADHIDIWRVLHAQRDIPASMREKDDPA